MSAEVLREAAALMRKRSERTEHEDPASNDGWYAHIGPAGTSWINNRTGHLISTHGFPRHAEHIASWHPAVALAVATWLEATARELDALGDPDLTAHPQDGRRTAAVAVAHAYLGRDA